MVLTRGPVAAGKRQIVWKMRPDVLDWLTDEAKRLGLDSKTAAANYWMTRLRTCQVFYSDTFRGEPAERQRPKRKVVSWRITEANWDWLGTLAGAFSTPSSAIEGGAGKQLRSKAAVVNHLLSRCMDGECKVQE